jgi:putative two-component system hydrogenase maturation factor HypX/HoxX
MQKITLLVTSFNSLSQAVYVWLKDNNYKVDVVYINSLTRDKEIEEFKPDIILCPFLKHYIPSSIYENYPTFVFHPGVRGDRGAYSIEWALINEEKRWGGVWLKAVKELDAGDIYAFGEFELEKKSKAYVYRVQEKKIALNSLEELLKNIEQENAIPQIQNPIHSKPEIAINWEKDSTKEIVKKINILDSDPGVKDTILGLDVYLFGAWEEEKLGDNTQIEPKTIIAKRDGAICLKTIDSAIWISHLKEENGFKLPATYVLKERLKGIKEHRLPLIFDKSYKTFYEVSCKIKEDIAYLDFNFLNGAFRAEQCIRLKYAIEYLREQVKCIVLMGGEQFFSNGINLNILEDSKKQGEDGWSTINAINELIESVLFASNIITIAYVNKNAGAGGVFLATACDFVVSSSDVVFNPHYKTIGLSGSEYHSYTLPKRVGQEMANKLLNKCLPISANFAKSIGLVDEIIDSKEALEEFAKSKVEEDFFDDFIWEKEDFLEENIENIKQYKEQELKIMYNEFWDEESPFHKLRRDFVYKVCPTTTPKRLKFKG